MQYELRTTFKMPNGDALVPGEIGRADRLLRQLYGDLPVEARMGDGVTPLQWSGNRYVEPKIVLEVATRYRTVFGLTADRFRIENAVATILSGHDRVSGKPRDFVEPVEYRVLRLYGLAELEEPANPTKKLSHPC
ncbi:MAG: hypothetical protein QOD68_2318 [Actinomycetota bacterium]|jgi:hypothetical protein|nr:hypothetical protein [Actinomycetota bacterium]